MYNSLPCLIRGLYAWLPDSPYWASSGHSFFFVQNDVLGYDCLKVIIAMVYLC